MNPAASANCWNSKKPREVILDDDVLGGAIKLTTTNPVFFHAAYFSVSSPKPVSKKSLQSE